LPRNQVVSHEHPGASASGAKRFRPLKGTAASKLWSHPAVVGVVGTVELWVSMADCKYPWVAEAWSIEEKYVALESGMVRHRRL